MNHSADQTIPVASTRGRMDGKCVVITGATSGIGRAAALALANAGAKLILVSRDHITGTALARRLSTTSSLCEFIEADLSALAQVRIAAHQIRDRCPTIDVLINNAGARFDTYTATPDQFERTFATNHLGHFLLTGLLLDRLAAAASARIITVSSSAAAHARLDEQWQFDAHNFDRKQAYAKSKLANLLFAFELARRLQGTAVTSLAIDPGVVATRFARNNGLIPWLKHLLYHGRRRELISATRGADTIVHLASVPVLPPEASGGYFRERQPIHPCPAACDPVAAANLWTLSTALTRHDPAPSPTNSPDAPQPKIRPPCTN